MNITIFSRISFYFTFKFQCSVRKVCFTVAGGEREREGLNSFFCFNCGRFVSVEPCLETALMGCVQFLESPSSWHFSFSLSLSLLIFSTGSPFSFLFRTQHSHLGFLLPSLPLLLNFFLFLQVLLLSLG